MWPFKKKNEERVSLNNPSTPISAIFDGGLRSDTGRVVTAETAMQNTVVYACVKILSETIASLPLHIYRRLPGGGKEKAIEHPLYKLLHSQPNPEMTSFEFFELSEAHLCLRGNTYSEKVYDRGGRIAELWPITPDRVSVGRSRTTQQLEYKINLPDGGTVVFGRNKIFHRKGLGGDGVTGYSIIKMAREAIGLSLATEEFGAKFFGNGAKPCGVLEHPGRLSNQTSKGNIQKSFEEKQAGLSNAHRLLILEEGMKYHQISLSQEDSQYLQTRNFQGVEIARMFNVPAIMVGLENKSSTYASAEQFFLSFVVNTMRPWLVRWEQGIKKDLFEEDNEEYFAEFLVDGLLRGDTASRYSAYSIGRNGGWLSADDIREKENMNPLPDGKGKEYLTPLNMVKTGEKIPEEKPPTDKDKDRVGRAFNGIFEDTLKRTIRREKADIMRQIRKQKDNFDAKAFDEWVNVFYAEHRTFVENNLAPIFRARSDALGMPVNIGESGEYATKHIEKIKKEIKLLTSNTSRDMEETLQTYFETRLNGQEEVSIESRTPELTKA